ncbi:hypothetical protein BDP27DRAFT_1428074 [Rhodocollybia butyracea]|uniref:DUF1348-domain-containing protein n=1 Tax=Rhodocollybia butyracea TaxID=206335 RepID=A0A9P5U070_9AGAR|nr:hypothetical protein BDP27DRAFT_1428074 [Rhodocollybia butyracea]
MSSGAELILPPFTRETALKKVKAAERNWNTRDPARVSLGYTPDSIWRNRDVFLKGREEIVGFLKAKWEREHFYVLRKELFGFEDDRIAVQFFYEWNEKPDGSGQWFRTYGLESLTSLLLFQKDWTFDRETGLMRKRMMSANDVRITENERWFTKGPEHVDEVEISERHL